MQLKFAETTSTSFLQVMEILDQSTSLKEARVNLHAAYKMDEIRAVLREFGAPSSSPDSGKWGDSSEDADDDKSVEVLSKEKKLEDPVTFDYVPISPLMVERILLSRPEWL